MTTEQHETVHLTITGKVQGVFYRASAKKRADGLGLTGWVRNTPDGNVELVASGPHGLLQTFIQWCRQGPENARVVDVLVQAQEQKIFSGFRIER